MSERYLYITHIYAVDKYTFLAAYDVFASFGHPLYFSIFFFSPLVHNAKCTATGSVYIPMVTTNKSVFLLLRCDEFSMFSRLVQQMRVLCTPTRHTVSPGGNNAR